MLNSAITVIAAAIRHWKCELDFSEGIVNAGEPNLSQPYVTASSNFHLLQNIKSIAVETVKIILQYDPLLNLPYPNLGQFVWHIQKTAAHIILVFR